MRALLFFNLLVLTITAAAQQTTSQKDTLITVSKGRYMLSYPPSWGIDTTSKLFGIDLLVYNPVKDSVTDFRENMTVIYQSLRGENYTLAKFGAESEAEIKRSMTDVSIMESRLDTTSAFKHYILKYTGTKSVLSFTSIQHYYLQNDIGYVVTFSIRIGKETEYISLAEKMLGSFRIR